MVQYLRIFALAVALPLLGGLVSFYAANSQADPCGTSPQVLSAPSLNTAEYLVFSPSEDSVPLSAVNIQPADEAIESIELEPALIQNHIEANNLAIQCSDRSLHPIGDPFATSLVSQHVRLQI